MSAKTTAAIYASTSIVLLALALLVAFLLQPPLLGWVGFAVVCTIVVSLATVATIAIVDQRELSPSSAGTPPSTTEKTTAFSSNQSVN